MATFANIDVDGGLLVVFAGLALIAVGIFVFVRDPHGAGGRTRIKVPFMEAELPVASLLPMLLGVALLLGGSKVPEGNARDTPVDSIQPDRSATRPPPVASCVGVTSLSLAAFKWAASDCADHPGSPIRIDGCAESRPLSWLKARLEELRTAKLEGYRDLPATFELRIADAFGKKDWALHVVSGEERLFSIGVGYNVKSGAKDGCLILVRNGKAVSPPACMDKSGEWWERRGQEMCAVRP